MQALKPTEIRTDQFHSFELIENSINSQIMKLKLEKKNYSNNSTTLEQLRPGASLKSSNITLYYDTQQTGCSSSNTTDSSKSGLHSPPPLQPPAPAQINFSNQTIKLDDLNIYYDYRLSSSDKTILSSANPSTVYRLQKILNIPKGREFISHSSHNFRLMKKFKFKLKKLETTKSTTTKYRLSKNIPQKQETFYKPASSYTGTTSPSQLPPPAPPSYPLSYPTTLAQEIIESAQPKLNARLLRSLANNSSSSEENDQDSDEPEANAPDEKIIQIEKIRNKLKEEYNNLLLNSTNIAVRPKSATVCCTPNIQYLKSTINKHSDLDTNIQDELRIIPLNKSLLSRPNSAATTKSKLSYARSINHINSNNTPKSRSRPHYIDCESDDLAYELDRSIGQFKYESSSSNLMINSTQLPVSRNNRDSKQSFYNTGNPASGCEEKRVYVTNPIKQVLHSSSTNSKIQFENLMSYAMNKQPNQICINGKSMSTSSGVEFVPNYENQNSVMFCFFFSVNLRF